MGRQDLLTCESHMVKSCVSTKWRTLSTCSTTPCLSAFTCKMGPTGFRRSRKFIAQTCQLTLIFEILSFISRKSHTELRPRHGMNCSIMTLDMTTVDGSVVREDRVATVIALLPTSVQNRFSPFRNIRRSISLSNIRGPSLSHREASPSRPRSEGNTTPPVSAEPVAASVEPAVHQELQVTRQDERLAGYSEEEIVKERFARQG
jgi:hypothetical protein